MGMQRDVRPRRLERGRHVLLLWGGYRVNAAIASAAAVTAVDSSEVAATAVAASAVVATAIVAATAAATAMHQH